MRRFPWLPVIVAVGVGVLMLGALLGSGTWAEVFMTKPDQLACMTVQTPTGKVTSCSTVEETTLLQRLTTNYTYAALRPRDGAGIAGAGSTTLVAHAAPRQPVPPPGGSGREGQTSLAQAVRVAERQTGERARQAEIEREQGVDVYEIDTVSKEGSASVHVDVASGNVVRVDTGGFVAVLAKVFDRDHQRKDQAALAGLEASSVPLADAIDAAQQETGGRAVKAELKSRYGSTLFEVKVVKDSTTQKVLIDPATARVVTAPGQGKRNGNN